MNGNLPFAHMFLLMLIVIPVAACWALALVDLIRRNDLSGWAIAFWLIVIIFIPIVGMVIYYIFRPAQQHTRQKAQPSDFYRKFHLDVQTPKHPQHKKPHHK